jgi:hypothetical protein
VATEKDGNLMGFRQEQRGKDKGPSLFSDSKILGFYCPVVIPQSDAAEIVERRI